MSENQVIVEQLRSEGVMMPNLLLVSSDQRIEAQRYGRSILPLLLADPEAEVPPLPGSQEGAGRAEDSERIGRERRKTASGAGRGAPYTILRG